MNFHHYTEQPDADELADLQRIADALHRVCSIIHVPVHVLFTAWCAYSESHFAGWINPPQDFDWPCRERDFCDRECVQMIAPYLPDTYRPASITFYARDPKWGPHP